MDTVLERGARVQTYDTVFERVAPTQYYDSRVFQDVPRGVDDTMCPKLGSRKY